MATLCSDSNIPLAIPNRFAHLGGYKAQYLILSFPLNHAFFSDTFMLWVEHDDFTQATLGGFLEKCSIIFCEALKRKIPLRGIVSRGTAIMDEENKIYLGTPIVEAARAEPTQEWLGVTLAKSCEEFHLSDIRYILPYDKHIKEGQDMWVSKLALDWPRWWREQEIEKAQLIINSMDTEPQCHKYYENTNKFITYSEKGDEIWNNILSHGSTTQPQ